MFTDPLPTNGRLLMLLLHINGCSCYTIITISTNALGLYLKSAVFESRPKRQLSYFHFSCTVSNANLC
jgi:hypothetical protein